MISLLLVPPSDTPTTDRACGDVGRHSTGWRSRFSSTAVMRFKYPPSKMTLDTAKRNLAFHSYEIQERKRQGGVSNVQYNSTQPGAVFCYKWNELTRKLARHCHVEARSRQRTPVQPSRLEVLRGSASRSVSKASSSLSVPLSRRRPCASAGEYHPSPFA